MKNAFAGTRRPHLAALIVLVAAAAPAALFAQNDIRTVPDQERVEAPGESSQKAETTIADWPESARAIARAMLQKYGEPERITDRGLLWEYNGPWRKTIAFRNASPHYRWIRDKDYLKQTIVYPIPDNKLAALARFDMRIKFDKSSGELSARSGSEALNYLALNLAQEIATDQRSVEDARAFYRKAQELSLSGKSSPYLEGFVFAIGVSAPSR
jgi:hypothetical protein